jgi:(p)ppGpp synthase/HD superfamily hydrolase
MLEQLLPHVLPEVSAGHELPAFESGEEDELAEEESESGGMHIKLAQCCCPIPGDGIVGQITPGKGMLVHRVDCRNIRRYRDVPNALVEMHWRQIDPESYLAPINIVAHDRSGLLRDVAAIVADAGINMTSVTSTTNQSLQKAIITATLEIDAHEEVLDQLERILRRLRQVKHVVSVERALAK